MSHNRPQLIFISDMSILEFFEYFNSFAKNDIANFEYFNSFAKNDIANFENFVFCHKQQEKVILVKNAIL